MAQTTAGARGFFRALPLRLLRPHWKPLLTALLAVFVGTLADVLEPWPVKVVVDNVVQSKRLPPGLGSVAVGLFGDSKYSVLAFALAAVMAIAIVGAAAGYLQSYLTTTVGQWIGHDLRRMLYQRIQRLSLVEHGQSRRGDLLTRVTTDIDAVQDFIGSALLGILASTLTLAGMIGVMLYVNWRFTLIALSITPVLFVVVYSYTRRIKKAARAVKKQETELLSNVSEVLTA